MDERQNRPSASYIEQMSLCPGSWRAQQGLPEQPNEDSKAGDEIHRYLAGELAQMDSEKLEIADNLQKKDEAVFLEFLNAYECHKEIRLWHPSGRYSAKIDALRFFQNTACISDYKTGRNEVAFAEGNLQLRAQVPLVRHHTGATEIYAAIIPAYARATVALYREADIQQAEAETLAIIDLAEKPDAPRIPGEKQCRYCRAKAQCPEAHDYVAALTTLPADSMISLRTETLVKALDRVALARKVCDALEDEAKRRLQAGDDVPGWKLGTTKPREKIVNLPQVHARASEMGVSVERFTHACSLTKKAAQEMIREATGAKGKELDEKMHVLTYGCIEEGASPEPKLERI